MFDLSEVPSMAIIDAMTIVESIKKAPQMKKIFTKHSPRKSEIHSQLSNTVSSAEITAKAKEEVLNAGVLGKEL